MLNIVLHNPEIPGNTGSIGRTCIALNFKLHLIHPLGFDLDEKAVRRAGLDYWKHVQLYEYDNFEDFLDKNNPETKQMYFFSRFAQDNSLFKRQFNNNDYFIFGSETRGLPEDMQAKYSNQVVSLPMDGEHIRSLNLSNAVTAAAYEAVRQFSL